MARLKLQKPIYINGAEVDTIQYDFDAMTARDMMIVSRNMMADGFPCTTVEEIDPVYHRYLFARAAEVADPKVTTGDVMRISARDIQKAGELARGFFYLIDSTDESSDS